MMRMIKSSKEIIAAGTFFITTFFIIVCSCVYEANILFTCALIIWAGVMIYSATDLKRHIVLLCFSVSFFVFLFGREICFAYLGLEKYYRYLEKHNDLTFGLICISLLCLLAGYILAEKYSVLFSGWQVKIKTKSRPSRLVRFGSRINSVYEKKLRLASLLAYCVCLAFSFTEVLLKIRLVSLVGYVGSYASDNVSAPSVVGYISSFTIIALSIYLSTCPSKKSTWAAIVFYELYGVFTMVTGHRYTFVAISMYNLTYIVFRHRREGGWVSKKLVIALVISIPFVLALMNAVNASRTGQEDGAKSGALLNTVISFLDQQGGSVNVIKRVMYYRDKLSDMILTSLSNTRTVLLENAIVRKVFGVKVFSGNSVENALYGHYLSHRLSYYEYGENYLTGHGVGSCYIAELFHDFGFIGVIVGNVIYGCFISCVNSIGSKRYYRDAMLLASQYYLFLAPRGDFDGMIGGLFSITAILGMIGIWALSILLRQKRQAQ